MALKPNALVTLATMKEFVKIPTDITSQDSLLEEFINAASNRCEQFCTRKFLTARIVEYHNGERNSEVLLQQWPVTTIHRINIDNNRVFDPADDLVAADYLEVKDEQQEIIGFEYFQRILPRGRQNILVDYTYGYADFDDLPSDLKQACLIIAAHAFDKQQDADWNVASKAKGDENFTNVQDIPQLAQTLLLSHKRLEMPLPNAPTVQR